MLYKIGLSVGQYHDKNNVDYRQLNSEFVNIEAIASDICYYIGQGHAFTAWCSKNWRVEENYILAQHLALDFDEGDVTPESLLADAFVAKYAMFIYPTLSWTPEVPRYRLLFLLDTPVHQAKNYRRAAEAMLWMYGTADKKAKDPVRFFFGASQRPDAGTHFVGKTLPLSKVQEVIAQHEASKAKKPVAIETAPASGDARGLIKYWEERVSSTPKGERNDVLNKAAFSFGELITQGKLTESDARARLEYAAAACGLKGVEVEMTIGSGLRAGRNK